MLSLCYAYYGGVMRKAILISALLTVSLAGFGQCPTVLENVWATSASTKGLDEIDSKVNDLVNTLSKRYEQNDSRKLYALFVKTHNRFLHNYVKYSGIEELAEGRYDCLTATSLFAHILTKSGYAFNIIETNYHIFITVKTSEGDVLLETTDRFGGFVDDKEKIAGVLKEYKKNTLEAATNSSYQYTFSLFNTVDPEQLPGLLYINQAVKAFNLERWDECEAKLAAAARMTDSPRIAELVQLVELKK